MGYLGCPTTAEARPDRGILVRGKKPLVNAWRDRELCGCGYLCLRYSYRVVVMLRYRVVCPLTCTSMDEYLQRRDCRGRGVAAFGGR